MEKVRRKKQHKQSHTAEYVCWENMLQRCLNPNNCNYPRYGARGILVCERWQGPNGFINFLSDVGRRPSSRHSLDRYPDNDGNYEPGNVRWATRSEQLRNTRRTLLVEFEGRMICATDLAAMTNLHRVSVSRYIKQGRSAEWILNHVSRKKRKTQA